MSNKKDIKLQAIALHNANYQAAKIAEIQEAKIKEGIKKIVEDSKGAK